jgi:hypothetical protein
MGHCSGCDGNCTGDSCDTHSHGDCGGCEDITLTIKNFSQEAGRASLKMLSRFTAVKKSRLSGNKLLFKLASPSEITRIKSFLKDKGIQLV